jgi:hypothetical protein
VTAEEIKRNLVEFARKWSLYDRSERAEAQTFLNELFAAYGQDRYEVGARFEEPQAGDGVPVTPSRTRTEEALGSYVNGQPMCLSDLGDFATETCSCGAHIGALSRSIKLILFPKHRHMYRRSYSLRWMWPAEVRAVPAHSEN